MVECKIKENKIFCNCTYNCDKKGICCECLRYHLKNGEVPACFFTDEVEKSYDRSIENFIKNYKEKK